MDILSSHRACRRAGAVTALVLTTLAACTGTSPRPADPLGACGRDRAPFLETDSLGLRTDFRGALSAAGDLDGNDDPEVVIVSPAGGVDVATVSPSDLVRTGSVRTLTAFASGGRVTGLAVADLDGDGADEIVVAGPVPGQPRSKVRVEVLSGGFQSTPQGIDLPTGYPSLSAADLNGDGNAEVLVADTNARTVSVLEFVGGALRVRQVLPVAAVNRIDVADLDGDARPDLVVSAFVIGQATFVVYPGDGAGFAGSPARTVAMASDRFALVASRFAASSGRQLLTATTTVESSDAQVASPNASLGFEARELLTLDVDGDGRQDLLAVAYPGALGASGPPLLGAVIYREGDQWGTPKAIELASPATAVLPILRRATVRIGEPGVPYLAVVTEEPTGAPQLRLVSNLCAPENTLKVTRIEPPVQVVQSRDGSVRLYSGKPTAVAVHVATRHALRGVTVQAVLKDPNGSISRQLVTAAPGPRQDLESGRDGEAVFHVVIPGGFAIAGDHVIEVSVRARRGATPTSRGGTVSIPVRFERSTPIRFALVDWRHGWCTTSSGSGCDPNSPVTIRPPTSNEDIEEAIRSLRAVLPSGDIDFLVTEVVDTAFAVPRNLLAPIVFSDAVPAARAQFEAAGPGRSGMAAYFIAPGAGGAVRTVPNLTGTGDVGKIAHEAGHMAGIRHVDCRPGNTPDFLELSFPFAGGRIGGPSDDPTRFTGARILDPDSRLPHVMTFPPETCDLMSYGLTTWPSSWTYGFFEAAMSRWAR